MLQQCFRIAGSLVLASALATLGSIAASCQSGAVPSSSTHKFSGGERACRDGLRQVGDACRPIETPANAYVTGATYGKGWACRHGYRESAESCIAIAVPDNAYLTGSSYGDGWKCGRGYEKEEFVALPS